MGQRRGFVHIKFVILACVFVSSRDAPTLLFGDHDYFSFASSFEDRTRRDCVAVT